MLFSGMLNELWIYTNAILLLCKLRFFVFSLLVRVTEKDEKHVLRQFSYILLYNPLIDNQ